MTTNDPHATGAQRAGTGIGAGSTAVDMVELERARAGLPSRDDEQGTTPRTPTDLSMTGPSADGRVADGEDEITPNEAHRERLSH